MAGAETRRLFFALWPDEDVRDAIIERRAALDRLNARRVPDRNLHLTLVFLGDRPRELLEDILRAAAPVPGAPFELLLDRFGHFPGAKVVWLGGEAPPAATALVDSLAGAMESIGLVVERRPWRPHVTLYRKVYRRPRFPDIAPVAWPVRDFVLVESIAGKPYRVLRSWPLTKGPD